ncbi:MAG TPA: murein biosynthesis integral membrane protein MurJ [Candidatus Limnocylindrales bacterium]|nr:murein biosynthesis integral membrane protein MurJ [Candidatus Limnocylindrales bacterium]
MTARTLARAGMIVAAAFLLSRVLGWVRIVVITNLFDAGTELDAYFAAFRLPDAIFQLVAAGALSSAMVPVLSNLFTKNEEQRAWRVVSTVLNMLLLALAAMAAVVAIFAPQIVPIFTPGFDAVGTELTVRLTRIMLLSPVMLALGAVAMSVLNARGRFAAAAIAPSLYNLAIIGGALLLGPYLGIESLAIGVVVGAMLHLAVQIRPLMKERFKLHFNIDLSDPQARQILLLMAPRTIGLGANQITFIVATTLATGVGLGAVTAYNVAWTVLQIPLGVIGFPLGVVLLPSLSRAVAAGSTKEFGTLIVRSARLVMWVMFFVTAIGIVLRRQVVTLLFDYGLDPDAISLTADTLSFMFLGLAGFTLVIVFARAFYSGHDTRTPVITAVFDMVVCVGIGLATIGTLGLSGVALGLAAGAWAEATALGVLLWRRTPGAGLEGIVQPMILFAIGSVLAAIVALLVVRVTDSIIGPDPGKIALLGQVLAAGAGGAAAYAIYTRALRIPELAHTVDLVRSMIRRK